MARSASVSCFRDVLTSLVLPAAAAVAHSAMPMRRYSSGMACSAAAPALGRTSATAVTKAPRIAPDQAPVRGPAGRLA
jgi:hypothetical protein